VILAVHVNPEFADTYIYALKPHAASILPSAEDDISRRSACTAEVADHVAPEFVDTYIPPPLLLLTVTANFVPSADEQMPCKEVTAAVLSFHVTPAFVDVYIPVP
jgi:hypothetical protein